MDRQLYYCLGFKENPFSKKSSEQETNFLKEIFFEPNYYSTLISGLGSGDTIFIIGQRGYGKTSIINNINKDLGKYPHILVILIDRYESIPDKNNEAHFIFIIIQEIIKKLSAELFKDKSIIRKLNHIQKGELCFFIQQFFRPISKLEFDDVCNSITLFKRKNIFRKIWNTLIYSANNITSGIVNVTSDAICRSLGLSGIDTSSNFRQYFPSLEIEDIRQIFITPEDVTLSELKNTLYAICDLYKSLDKKTIVILFDKVDEFNSLGYDIDKIASFVKGFLSDTELLLSPCIAIGFSLWSELRSELRGFVRFDKFNISDVRWEDWNMEPLMNKRLKYFSKENKDITFSDLISSEIDRKEIIELANKSPRDLITLMDSIYQEQANINSNVCSFDDRCIRLGMINFCKNYEYESQTLSNTGRNKDIRAMINRLLKQKLHDFTYKDLSKALGQNDNQSEGQIKLMIKYRIVREDELSTRNGLKVYEIIDPKIRFLIKHLVERIE